MFQSIYPPFQEVDPLLQEVIHAFKFRTNNLRGILYLGQVLFYFFEVSQQLLKEVGHHTQKQRQHTAQNDIQLRISHHW